MFIFLLSTVFVGGFSCLCGLIKQCFLTICSSFCGVNWKGKNTEQWCSIDIINSTCMRQLDANLRNGRLLTSGLQNTFLFSFFWCRVPVNRTTTMQRKYAANITAVPEVMKKEFTVYSLSVSFVVSKEQGSYLIKRQVKLCSYVIMVAKWFTQHWFGQTIK